MTDNNFYDFHEDECKNNILESDNEINKKFINEIKNNNYDINKPKEENMKYTVFKEFKEEEESNNQESHISRIIIGEIDGYKDIIEKDKINNILNQNAIINDRISFNESEDSDKKIINMINIEDDFDNMSTNDFKNHIKFDKVKINKINNDNKKNEKNYINSCSLNKKLSTGRCINKLVNIKFGNYNNIKYKKNSNVNNKINNKNKLKNLLKRETNINKKYKLSNIYNNKNVNINNISKIKTAVNSNINGDNKNITCNELNEDKINFIVQNNEEENKKNDNCFIL